MFIRICRQCLLLRVLGAKEFEGGSKLIKHDLRKPFPLWSIILACFLLVVATTIKIKQKHSELNKHVQLILFT